MSRKKSLEETGEDEAETNQLAKINQSN